MEEKKIITHVIGPPKQVEKLQTRADEASEETEKRLTDIDVAEELHKRMGDA